ncbi:MAG: flagellar basal body L-ring protein FlgH [Methylophilaceae bacterium]
MNSLIRFCFLLIGALVLVGCDSDPPTRVQLPTTIRPNPAPVAVADGAIYHAANSRPIFEDRRARFVGDTITVLLVEKTSANRTTKEAANRKSSAAVAIGTPKVLGVTPKLPFSANVLNTQIDNDLSSSFNSSSDVSTSDDQDDRNTNTVTGSITVTVIEVLPNGNLMVSGEKQVAVNQGTEFVRLSGVVNPINISGSNTVNSTLLADARIESKQNQSIDTAQVLSVMARFFTLLLPF